MSYVYRSLSSGRNWMREIHTTLDLISCILYLGNLRNQKGLRGPASWARADTRNSSIPFLRD